MPFSALQIEGRPLRDVNGRTVGRVSAAYRYPASIDAPWGVAAVTRGSIVRSTHLVDLFDASLDGDAVVVAYPIETIKAAPNYPAMVGRTLRDDHAARVLSHYRGTPQLV